MDVSLFGADEIDEAITIRDDVDLLLKSEDFELRKWTANLSELLPNQSSANDKVFLDTSEASHKRILGVGWSSSSDEFFTKNSEIPQQAITKRTILSNIAKIFDPLGWFSPFTIRAKMLIQQL